MNIITDIRDLETMVDYYSFQDAFAFDVETWGDNRLDPIRNDVLWIALSTEGRTDVIPMGHPNGDFLHWEKPVLASGLARLEKGYELREMDYSKDQKKWTPHFTEAPTQLSPGEVFATLKPLFFSKTITKVAHNAKFDIKSIAKYYGGKSPETPFFCTRIAVPILDTRNIHKSSLEATVKRELDIEMVKGVGAEVERHDFNTVATYAGTDAELTYKVYKNMLPRFAQDNLEVVWQLEMDTLKVVCDMELAGALLDVSAMEGLQERLEIDIDLSRADCYRVAGRAFNLNSPSEKQKLLFLPKDQGGRGIRPSTKAKVALTDGGWERKLNGESLTVKDYSTGRDALEAITTRDELVTSLLDYMEYNKLLTTYITPYLGGDVVRTNNGKSRIVSKEALLVDGRVHGDFQQSGTVTGRFSSKQPNLQNIPNPRTEYGRLIRNLFVAPPGHKLVVADYSQIEPRIIASFSEDPVWMNSYLNDEDIYTAIADPLGIDRAGGKVLVLSLSYGVGPDKVANSLGITVTEARGLMRDFEDRFKKVSRYKKEVIARAASKRPVPYVTTVLGRRRYLPDLRSIEPGYKASAERQAFNTVIQGSGADIIKLAMVRAHSCFVDEPDVNIILTVHDEIVTVTPDHLADEVAEAIRESMEGVKVPGIKVPLIADVKIVDKWGDAK